jgi:hypothetical protein
MSRATVILTTGPAGSGKTYVRGPAFLVGSFLKECDGVHWSNLPLFADKIADYAGRRLGLDPGRVLSRLRAIPAGELVKWRAGTSGPWEYFADIDLQGAHVAIDEVHNFCGKKTAKPVRQKWQEWLGEIRHRGATIELISQHPQKIADELRWEAETSYSIVNSENRRDAVCGILFADWYELRAGLLMGEYRSCCWQIEKRSVDGKQHVEDQRVFWLDPDLFALYDSYSQPHTGGVKGEAVQRVFQKRSKIGLVAWFVKRNCVRLVLRAAAAGALFWLATGGGGVLMSGALDMIQGSIAANGAQRESGKPLKPIAAKSHFEKVAAKHGLEPSPMPERLQRAATAVAVVKGMGESSSTEGLKPIAVPTPAEARLDELQRKIDQLTAVREQEMKAAGIRLLTPEGMAFGDGVVYKLGDQIEAGPFGGRRVMAVSWAKRRVVLDDGTILRMALANRPPEPAVAVDGVHEGAGVGSGAPVPASVQGVGGAAAGVGERAGVRAAADALRSEYAHPRILQARSASGQRVDSGGSQFGRANDQSGPTRATSRAGVGSGGEAAGGASSTGRVSILSRGNAG